MNEPAPALSPLTLRVHAGGLVAREVVVIPGVPALVGREETAAVVVNHRSISRVHAEVVWEASGPEMRDRDSRNGLWLDGARVASVALVPGQRFRVGEVPFEVAKPAPPPQAAPNASPTLLADSLQTLLTTSADRSTGSTLRLSSDSRLSPGELRLQVLLQVSQTLSSPDRVEVVLERILDLAFQILEIERAVLLLVNEKGRLVPQVLRPIADAAWWSTTVVEATVRNGRAALYADATADPRLLAAHSIAREGISGSMAVPLTGRTGVLGVLYADTRGVAHLFDDQDLAFLQAFGQHAAAAIENGRLVERLEREAAHRGNLVRFFPPAIAAKLLHGSLDTVETDVTAMFCDISDFVTLTAGLPPSEVIRMLNAFFPAVARIIFDAGGTLEKYAGDAVLAVWGAPWRRDDDADRAVFAARAIQRHAEARRADPHRVGPPFRLHIGLHSGPVAAGNIGSSDFVQYCTVGETTNVAARMCAAAGPGEILCSDVTWKRLSNPTGGQPRDGMVLKGRPGTSRGWVLGTGPNASRRGP